MHDDIVFDISNVPEYAKQFSLMHRIAKLIGMDLHCTINVIFNSDYGFLRLFLTSKFGFTYFFKNMCRFNVQHKLDDFNTHIITNNDNENIATSEPSVCERIKYTVIDEPKKMKALIKKLVSDFVTIFILDREILKSCYDPNLTHLLKSKWSWTKVIDFEISSESELEMFLTVNGI